MSVAICNKCHELVPYKGAIKRVRCKCGSDDLVAVAGKWNDQKGGWDYFDRSGAFVKHVPVKNQFPDKH